MASAYSELLKVVRDEGLLEGRAKYYRGLVTSNLAIFTLGWLIFLTVGDSWYQAITAVAMAVIFAQTAFLVHDAGHRQIAKSRRMNDLVGMLLGTLLLGFSYSWWVGKHHRHHVHPNHTGKDPDIVNTFIAFTPSQAREGLRRYTSTIQAYLFIPFSLLQALSMHVHSIGALLDPRHKHRLVETLLILVHAVLYLGTALLVLSPLKAAVFIFTHQALLGLYLVCAFAPNHKGMPILDQTDGVDFTTRQVLTSRNVQGGRVIAFLFGGLNFQIEHHLFPNMPRPNLRRAQPLVRAFCLARGIAYVEAGPRDSFLRVMRHLHVVGLAGETSLEDRHA